MAELPVARQTVDTSLSAAFTPKIQFFMREKHPKTHELMQYNATGAMLALKAMNVISAVNLNEQQYFGENDGEIGPKVWKDYKEKIKEALEKCNGDERLEQARDDLAEIFHRAHFERFPRWPAPGKEQQSIVNVNCEGQYEWGEPETQNRYFIVWACEGNITVTDRTELVEGGDNAEPQGIPLPAELAELLLRPSGDEKSEDGDEEKSDGPPGKPDLLAALLLSAVIVGGRTRKHAEFRGRPSLKILYVNMLALEEFEQNAAKHMETAKKACDNMQRRQVRGITFEDLI